jgi:hypothetical protein
VRVRRRAGGPWSPAAHRPVSAQFSRTGLQPRGPGRAVTKGRTAAAPTTARLELSCTAPERKRRGDEGAGGHRAPAGGGWHTSIGRTSDRWDSSTASPSSARAGDTRFRPLGPGPVDRRSSPRSSNPPASRCPTQSRPRGFRFGDAVVEVRHAVLATRHTETIARGGGRAQASGRGLTGGDAGGRPTTCGQVSRGNRRANRGPPRHGRPVLVRRRRCQASRSRSGAVSFRSTACSGSRCPRHARPCHGRCARLERLVGRDRRGHRRHDGRAGAPTARADRCRMCPLEGHSGRSPLAIASIVWFESLSSRLFVTQ